jgi:hypothetical protein
MKKISVITPSYRPDGLEMLWHSLKTQTMPHTDFEWIVCSPFHYQRATRWVQDPQKNPGDLYGYHKAINALIKESDCELTIWVNDMSILYPDVLEKFWKHYLEEPMNLYCGLANPGIKEFDPITKYWPDVRWDYVKDEKIRPSNLINFDTALSGIPKKALDTIKYPYIAPEYDQFACWGDRELLVNLIKQGYKLNIDSTINFTGISHYGHPEFPDWDKRFTDGQRFFETRNGDVNRY